MSLKSICFSLWLPIPSFTTATDAIGSSYSFPFKNQNQSVSHFGYSRPRRLHCSNKLDSVSDEDDYDCDEDSKAEQLDLDIELEIEKTGQNCRRIRSEIGIEAPLSTVWDLLTDYERLADFIPGLAVCQLLHKKDNYARLFQIGEQDLAFGLKFNAKGIVDCYENALESIPSELGGQTLRRDIDFNMVEGDFEIFRGKWSLQQLNTSGEIACDSLVDQQMHTTTTLSYYVDVKPKMWLPVRLVEGRLCKEIKINLASIRQEALKITRLGTDEKAIISILAHRTARQRCSIRQNYVEKYGEDLFKELEKELSGDFLRAVLVWTPHPAERDAMLAKEASTSPKKSLEDYFVIMEIGCTRTSQELFLVRQDYHARYKRSLEEDVACCTSGDFRKLLVPLVTCYRYEPHDEALVDTALVNSEAKILHDKIFSDKDCSHEEIIRILTTRSKPHLRATLQNYNEQFGHPINKDLKKKPKDEYLALLRATIKCLTCPEKYFEKALRLSMKGLGTKEETLTRVVVTRAEIDMKPIMEQYQRKNNVPLVNDIKGDTSGDYLTMLLALIN